MKPLPPSQVIAEYRTAHASVHPMEPPHLLYHRGWFTFYGEPNRRYRGAQIIHMTATLNERAKAKG